MKAWAAEHKGKAAAILIAGSTLGSVAGSGVSVALYGWNPSWLPGIFAVTLVLTLLGCFTGIVLSLIAIVTIDYKGQKRELRG